MPTCSDCQSDLAKADFSKNQLRKDPNSRRCKACVKLLATQATSQSSVQSSSETTVPVPVPSPSETSAPEIVSEVKPVEVVEVVPSDEEKDISQPAVNTVEMSQSSEAAECDEPTANDAVESKPAEESSDIVVEEQDKEMHIEESEESSDIVVEESSDIVVEEEQDKEKDIGESDESSDIVVEKSSGIVVEEQDREIHIGESVNVSVTSDGASGIIEYVNVPATSGGAFGDDVGSESLEEMVQNENTTKETNVSNKGESEREKESVPDDSKIPDEVVNVKDEVEEEKNKFIPDDTTIPSPPPDETTLPSPPPAQEIIKVDTAEMVRVQEVDCRETESVGDLSARTSNRIRVGICAMDKKARSKPMGEILNRLDEGLFEIIFFGDEMIVDMPVEEWPVCDVLIAFFSGGYPLKKAEKYAEMHKPFLLNDLKMQRVLKDRRRVYDLLEASGIDVPRHVFMNRDGYVSNLKDNGENDVTGDDGSGSEEEGSELVEYDDHIEVDGVTISKPFVEKPVDADDHNIAIYYPTSAGGGCKKLFRKIGNRSSEFYPDINEIRREGSYIYEEFVETQGTDVKMYTVGPDYGHAEARKSPTVDGKVQRGVDGKEVRFPVILTLQEKEIARRIVVVFKQLVCGFDLLRVQEADSLVSFVCDVNGWSFVKSSRKYYDDCAQLLTEHMLAAVKPKALHGFSALDPLLTTMKDFVQTPRRRRHKHKPVSRKVNCPPSPMKEELSDADKDDASFLSNQSAAVTLEEGAKRVREMPDMLMNNPASISAHSSVNGDDDTQSTMVANGTHQEELRCVIAVVRHGDRTPKQKLKINMTEPLLLKYFHKYSKNCKKDLKIKDKKPMIEFLNTVLAMIAEKEAAGMKNNKLLYKLCHMRDVLERWKIGGLNRKMQMKPRKWDEFQDENGKKILRCAEVQLILKWGGNLTKLGEKQAIRLGERLRTDMYPNTPGGGILRLHSTFRHDMKIKTSDEGRVMKTAAAFAKGLLELEGSIPPILVSLVHKEKDSLHMLDPSGNKEVKEELEVCKREVNEHMQKSFDVKDATPEMLEAAVGPKELVSMRKALSAVGNPQETLFAIRNTIGELLVQLDEMLGIMSSDAEHKHEGGEGLKGDEEDDEALSGIKLYKGETLLELTERWRILYTKLYDEDTNEFDLSRVPDVHDNVRFDMLHNPHLGLTATLEELYNMAKVMADCVVPQEYGTTRKQKRSIGNKMCRALLEKIKDDLIIARTDNQVDMRYMINLDYSADLPINTMGRRVRTRLYFTSESHLHTLLNVLRFPSEAPGAKKSPLSNHGIDIIGSAPELCYLTQVVIRLFENTSKDVNDTKRFRIEILFSPGATATPLHKSELRRDDEDVSRFDTEPQQLISSDYLTCKEVEVYFSESIKEGGTEDDDDMPSDMTSCEEGKKVKASTEMPKVKAATSAKPSPTDAAPAPSHNSDGNVPHVRSVVIAEDKNLEIEPEITNSTDEADETTENDEESVQLNKVDAMARILSKQFVWTSVAAVSFVIGIGFLVLSREVVQHDFKTRRWSRR